MSVPATRSMTGYASVRVELSPTSAAVVSIKAVNHRFLDLQVRVPMQSDALEAELRRLVKASVARGHVELTVQFERQAQRVVAFNEELLSGYVAAFRSAAERLGVASEPDLNELMRLPGMMVVQERATPEESAASEAAIVSAMPELLTAFNDSRAAEGATLAATLMEGMSRLKQLAAEVSVLRVDVRDAAVERLRARLTELTARAEGVAVFTEERLLAEAAVLADRSDVEEELVRLETHAERFATLLREGGEVGKRLDFLVQELNREANTLLSKTGGAATANGLRITELGLEMKMEIERAKEQLQNLE